HDVDILSGLQFTQLKRSELHLCGPAPTKDMNISSLGCFEPLGDVICYFCRQHLAGRFRYNAGHIKRNISDTNDSNFTCPQIPVPINIRMTVIPGDKFCGTKRVFGVNTRNIEPSIFDCTGCKYDYIVISAQLFEMNVRAVFYVSNKPYITAIHDAVQSFHDAFDSRMVGSHTVTNQTKRCWVTIKKIY